MKKKLIEVAPPLDAVNVASARAVIFAQMVDDPSAQPDRFPTEEAQEKERQRLFRLIEELVKWENTTNEALLRAARDEIRASWRRTCAENAADPRAGELFDPDRLPAFHDPFAGGGALPLEAQRLGLEAHASDLNPVKVGGSEAGALGTGASEAEANVPKHGAPGNAGVPPASGPKARPSAARRGRGTRCGPGAWLRPAADQGSCMLRLLSSAQSGHPGRARNVWASRRRAVAPTPLLSGSVSGLAAGP